MRTSAATLRGFALGARAGENRESSLSGTCSCSLGGDEHPGRHVQVRRSSSATFMFLSIERPTMKQSPVARLCGADRLLQARRHVGGERGHQDRALCSLEDGLQGPHRRCVRWGSCPSCLRVGAVAPQAAGTFVTDAGETGQVGRLLPHRRAVDLEVAGMHRSSPRGRAHDQARRRRGWRVACTHSTSEATPSVRESPGRTVCSSVVSMSSMPHAACCAGNPSVSAVLQDGHGQPGQGRTGSALMWPS